MSLNRSKSLKRHRATRLYCQKTLAIEQVVCTIYIYVYPMQSIRPRYISLGVVGTYVPRNMHVTSVYTHAESSCPFGGESVLVKDRFATRSTAILSPYALERIKSDEMRITRRPKFIGRFTSSSLYPLRDIKN